MIPLIALVKRELLTSLRRTRAFVFLCVCVCAVAWPVILVWATMPTQVGANYFQSGGAASQMVGLAAYALLFTCGLFVPAMASSGIVEERIRGTLDQLELAFVNPSGMVAAKIVNAVGFFLILVVGTLPFVATTFFLVGVEWKVVVQAYALVLASCVSCAAVGLLASAYFRRTSSAVAAGYMLAWALLGVPSIVALFINAAAGRLVRSGIFEPVVGLFAPILALDTVITGHYPWWLFGIALAYQIAAAVAAVTLTILLLTTRSHEESMRLLGNGRGGRIFALVRRVARFRKLGNRRPIPDRWNPILLREIRYGVLRSRKSLFAIVGLGLALYALFFLCAFGGSRVRVLGFRIAEPKEFWLLAQMGVVVVTAPLFAAHAIARERDAGTLELLRTTLLRPRDVFHGKAASAALPVLASIAASALAIAGYLLVASTESIDRFREHGLRFAVLCSTMFTGGVTIAVCAGVSLCLGLFASVCVRRGSTALVLALVLVLAVFVLSVALPYVTLATLLDDSFHGSLGSEKVKALRTFCSFCSPPAAFYANTVIQRPAYKLPEGGVMAHVTVYWAGNIATFSAFALAVYLAALGIFTKRFRAG
ncbi:MAG: ABC transporter permease [bacterium]|nr:ABC transporter permease [bacterium]